MSNTGRAVLVRWPFLLFTKGCELVSAVLSGPSFTSEVGTHPNRESFTDGEETEETWEVDGIGSYMIYQYKYIRIM